MTDLEQLARGLSEGPSRELDAAIACVIGRPLGNIDHWLHGADITYRPTAHGYYVGVLPDGRTTEAFAAREFTASLDAAMTLVPDDWYLKLTGVNDSWHVGLNATNFGPLRQSFGFAQNPALALCAAAIQARAHLRSQGGA